MAYDADATIEANDKKFSNFGQRIAHEVRAGGLKGHPSAVSYFEEPPCFQRALRPKLREVALIEDSKTDRGREVHVSRPNDGRDFDQESCARVGD